MSYAGKGRRKIVSEFSSDDLKDVDNVITLLNGAFKIHDLNRVEIKYLLEYRKNVQPILEKEKAIRPEINNMVVLNHAQMITRDIVGYFLGTPIQYIQSGADFKDEVEELNKFVSFEDKSSIDLEIGEFQSITGVGYRIIYTDGQYADEIPFEDKALNPLNTFVVYQNDISERPLAGVTYHVTYDKDNNINGTKIYVYTHHGSYEITSTGLASSINNYEHTYSSYNVGGVPIIEYPNNQWRIGDWELMISLMDAINNLHSGRLDDIDQMIQSLMVFLNADIDKERYDEMREAGAIMLKNSTGNRSDVKIVSAPMDQSGLNMFAQELESLLYALIGIPDRNNRSGGGGDTGVAVELRDGWADLEIVARNKEMSFKKAEKQSLRIILKILENKLGFKMSLLDVDIKFSRNKNNNLLVKVQSYQGLLSTKTLSPSDCLTIVDLVSDVNEFVNRGEAFWGDSFAGKIQSDIGVALSTKALETPDVATNEENNTKPEQIPPKKPE